MFGKARTSRARTLALIVVALVLLASSSIAADKKPAAAKKPTNAECLACHSDASLTHEVNGKTASLAVDETKFKASIHGSLGMKCVDCHTDLQEAPHNQAPKKVSCATCHEDTDKQYSHSVHAAAVQRGGVAADRAPGCQSCHGNVHEILPAGDPNSRVYRANIPQTCGNCHGQKYVMESAGISPTTFANYQLSVHGKAVAAGDTKAAVCTDCHGTHEIVGPGDVKSKIFKLNVPQTCAQCHEKVQQEFAQSIHGTAIAHGNWAAPVCTDCHGIHTIKQHLDPKSSVAAANLARDTCARCHEGVRLTQDFGIPGARASTYLDSYHGLASTLGSQVVANCASCHGVHNILPSSDPRSMIFPANLAKTCGQCHRGASTKFAAAKVHIAAPLSRDAGSLGTMWVRRIYTSMIAATIGLMLLHNFLLWRRKALARRREGGRRVRRMSRGQRAQHFLLLGSFLFLALSGFALKYPDSWMAWLLGSSESVRRIGHRIAAVVLMGAGLYHLFYIAFTAEGRRLVKDFLPRLKDVRDLRQALLYGVGRRQQGPLFARFSYADKIEYLALVWGTILMAVTGLVLWFPVLAGGLVQRWWLDVAAAVHFYEAILAVSAIFVWHFYFVIFDPDVYPINWAFWDGTITEEHRHHHHPLWHPDELPAAENSAEPEAELVTQRTETKR